MKLLLQSLTWTRHPEALDAQRRASKGAARAGPCVLRGSPAKEAGSRLRTTDSRLRQLLKLMTQ
jgi:hypothetical protein